MILFIEHVSKKVKEVEVKISEHEVIMKEILGPNFTAIDDSINQSIGKYRDFLQATKIKNYQRDTEDYQLHQVYAWEGPRTGAPRGRRLRIQKEPTIGRNDKAFVQKWGEILNKCSIDLMILFIEHVSKKVKEVEVKISEHEVIMKEILGPNFTAIDDSINHDSSYHRTQTYFLARKQYNNKAPQKKRNDVGEACGQRGVRNTGHGHGATAGR
ncbi:unnamed protein product, partial [Coregonus sp. 'balchen']